MRKHKQKVFHKSLSVEQWLAAMENSHDQTGGATTAEISAQTGMSTDKVRAHLRTLQREGKLTCVWAYRTRLDGRKCRVPTYLLSDTGDA